MRGLSQSIRDNLDRRLSCGSPRPLAVAFSGGGDSLALLLVADAWAREAGRDLAVLTVDHGLQPDSAGWSAACARTAERLGRPFRALTWTGEKPTRGLPAAARAARHRLLADAARELGAAVILMGHTADDVLEAQAMRAAGATTPEPRTWSPSPAWPEGRGLFLLRPMLEVRRAAIRAWLSARGESWIDDPANADQRYARSRARPAAAQAAAPTPAEPAPVRLAEAADEQAGIITVPRAVLRGAAEADAVRLVAIACVCAGGGDRRPASPRIGRLVAALRDQGPVVATLAGARVEADKDRVTIFREAGEAGRGGLTSAELEPGRPLVWDGRFELSAARSGVAVRRLSGLAARLPERERHAVRRFPAAARGALPAVVDGEAVSCPLLSPDPELRACSLVGERLRAAAGLILREPD